MRFLVVVPKREAIPLSESPRTTVYVETGAGAAGAGAGAASAGAEGAGAGVARSRRMPFSITKRPTSADIASPGTRALTWEAVMLTAFAQFNPQVAISSQLAKARREPLCIKK
jgi:hypothetical protein